MSQQIKGINANLQGFYKVAIVDPKTKEVVWEQPNWEKNLILNTGMNQIPLRSIADCMTYACAGTGVRSNAFAGGVSTITQSGNLIYMNTHLGTVSDFTASVETYSSYAEVGDVLVYGNGSHSMVSAIYSEDGYKLQVTTSYEIPVTDAQTFTIYKTTQTDLVTEPDPPGRTTTYYAGTAARCGTSTVSNVKTHRRTYDFDAEPAGGHTYYELGISWGATSDLFSRIVPTSGIFVDEGYTLRLVYDLQITYTPLSAITKPMSISGWTSTTGSECIQNFFTSKITTADGSSDNSEAILDPYHVSVSSTYYSALWCSSNSQSMAAFGSAVNRQLPASGRSTAVMTLGSYTDNVFRIDKTGVIPIGEGNMTNIKSIGFGRYYSGIHPADASNQVICMILENSEAKYSSETLTMVYRFLWSRTLS